MKANVYDFLLSLYKGSDELRPKLNKPNLSGDVVCATDAQAIILINPEKCGLKYDTNPDYPNIQGVIPKAGQVSKVSLSDLVSEIARYQVIYPECQPKEKCDECGATGKEVCDHCGGEYECGYCDGEGYLTVEYQTLQKDVARGENYNFNTMRIGKRHLNMRYALMLADTCAYLGVQEIELLNSDADLPTGFYFKITDDVRAVIMPINKSN